MENVLTYISTCTSLKELEQIELALHSQEQLVHIQQIKEEIENKGYSIQPQHYENESLQEYKQQYLRYYVQLQAFPTSSSSSSLGETEIKNNTIQISRALEKQDPWVQAIGFQIDVSKIHLFECEYTSKEWTKKKEEKEEIYIREGYIYLTLYYKTSILPPEKYSFHGIYWNEEINGEKMYIKNNRINFLSKKNKKKQKEQNSLKNNMFVFPETVESFLL